MKRLVSICLILTLVLLCVGTEVASAAGYRVKLMGRAPNDFAGTTGVNNGLSVVGKGTKVFAIADTVGSNLSGTFAWSLVKPSGSVAVLDSANKFGTSFTADTIGFYYLTLTLGANAPVSDTVFAGTYKGILDLAVAGCACHPAGSAQDKAFQDWKKTGHAQIFKQGISGMLEVETNPLDGKKYGAYTKTCARCHTVGYDVTKNNNNFAYVAHTQPAPAPASWDSTWWKSLGYIAGSTDFAIPYDTSFAIWKAMPAQLQPLGTIGCENCHGPLNEHTTFTSGFAGQHNTVAKSYDAGVCNQCHNASATSHNIGGYYNKSAHALTPSEQRGNCAPCHQGYSFIKWMDSNKDTTGWASKLTPEQLATQITCAACHDPHKASTLAADGVTMDVGLRQVSVDSLRNGFKFKPAGASQVCSYCHSSRYNVKARVTTTAPYYGFVDRFSPHENPQYDMLVGSNGYQFGDETFTGLNTHMGLDDGCVTCHMQLRIKVRGTAHSNHSMSMTDTTGGFKPTAVCSDCHGEIAEFDEVKAFYDYDRNGKIEGVQTEVQGLLNKLKAQLPVDATGEPVTRTADSLKVKGHPEFVQGIWNYYFVKNDGSMGVHNTKYAVRLLYKSLGWTPLSVEMIGGTMPTTYALDQNYPNPFNPSTKIRFALPKDDVVKLEVYDITGALVKSLVNQAVRAGRMEVTWDGTNNSGAKVTSGMYFYRLQAGTSFVTSKKMLLLK